jgi:hypothetical protein
MTITLFWVFIQQVVVILTQAVHIKTLNIELNPICHLLALLGAHPNLYVSRITVKETP